MSQYISPSPTFLTAAPFGLTFPYVDEAQALTIPALDKALSILTNGVAEAAPLYVPDGNTPRIVSRPTDQTAPEFWAEVARCLVLYGNWVALRLNDVDGNLIGVVPIHPVFVKTWRKRDGTIEYLVSGIEGVKGFAPNQVVHIRGLYTMPGNINGIGVLERHLRAIGLALDTNKYLTHVVRNHGPSYVITVGADAADEYTDDEQLDALAEFFDEKYSKATPGTAYLPRDIKLEALGWNPSELALSEARAANAVDMALMLGLTADDIGYVAPSGGQSMTYANITDRRAARYTDAISPLLDRIEASWQDFTATPCRFDRESLTAMDKPQTATYLKTAAEAIKAANESGIIDVEAFAAQLGVALKVGQ